MRIADRRQRCVGIVVDLPKHPALTIAQKHRKRLTLQLGQDTAIEIRDVPIGYRVRVYKVQRKVLESDHDGLFPQSPNSREFGPKRKGPNSDEFGNDKTRTHRPTAIARLTRSAPSAYNLRV